MAEMSELKDSCAMARKLKVLASGLGCGEGM
jgi:hypothetical protein